VKGHPGGEPDGIAADCFWVLAMYGGGPATPAVLRERIAGENEPFGWAVPAPGQVRGALYGLARRGLVARQGRPVSWRITGHGRDMIEVWCPPGPDGLGPEPGRVPCGLGWPDSSGEGAGVRPGRPDRVTEGSATSPFSAIGAG
jgi:hypothetical protein